MTVYGDFSIGYIVTPTLPPDAAPSRRRRSAPQPDNDELRVLGWFMSRHFSTKRSAD